MTQRKLLRGLVPLAVGGLLLAGCSAGTTPGDDGETFVYPSWMWEEGDVGVWHKQRMAEFEAAHKGVKVQATQIGAGDFENQINTQISAGQFPDLMPAFTGMMPSLIANDLLAPLDECFAGTDLPDRVLPSISVAEKDGKTYGAPLTMSPQGLIYNSELMKQAGIDEVPTTADELYSASKAIFETTGKFGYAYATDNADVQQHYINSLQWMLGYGGDWSSEDGSITADDPRNVEALKAYLSFYEDGLTPKGLNADEIRTLFAEGGAAFIIDGPWAITQVQSDNAELYPSVGYAPPPTPGHTAVTGGAFWVIPAGSKNYDLACDYLKINLGEDVQREWLEGLLQIPGTNVKPSPAFIEKNPWVNEMAIVAAKYPGGLGYAPPGHRLEAAAFRQTAVDSLIGVFSGSTSVEDALKEAQKNLTAEFGG
ncbi:ABC transporter substrate-binding protein [Microbacterium sp.]|uniref:ABC transporter substrate-binding protein n=1 Tax=Microbacterium sp. TaxID=51671 RepID=UPI003C738667